jgi:hypothetical protein
MEPHQDEPKMSPEPHREEPKPRRFRIVKLEERIAPLSGGNLARNRPPTTTIDPYLC